MAASSNLLTREFDLGVLTPEDERIPEDVRVRFNSYDKIVATVVPVISVSREEWWLFDADGSMIDMLCRRTDAARSALRDPSVRHIVHRAIQSDRP